jgi:hypothetical protein
MIMSRNLFLAVLLLLIPFCGFAQIDSFRFSNNLADSGAFANINNYVEKHYLGDDIAHKMYMVKETYTYIEVGSPSSPGDKTQVNKPVIYYAIKKLNTYYKKQLKKGELDQQEAYKRMARYLDIVFSIYNEDTTILEDELRAAKKASDIDKVFARVVLE